MPKESNTVNETYRIVREYNAIDRRLWSEFVATHPNGTIFQTPEYFEIHQGALGFKPYIIAAIDQQNGIAGVMLAIISHVYNGFLGYFTSRAVIAGGPLVKDNDTTIANLLIRSYLQDKQVKVIYSQFRNLFDTSALKQAFEEAHALFEDHLNILIDLTQSEEGLWKGVKSRKRNNIRQAQRKGLVVKRITTSNAAMQAYSILQEVYSRAKLPLAHQSLFLKAFEIMNNNNMLRIYGAFHEEQLAGAMFILSHNGRFYDWYAGSFRQYYSFNPNDIIPWEIFKIGKDENIRLFDFGGAGKPGIPYGVRDYKIQFGGELVNFGRYELPHNQFIFSSMKMAFKIWQKFH
jgi:serine/alanine adding enzyme